MLTYKVINQTTVISTSDRHNSYKFSALSLDDLDYRSLLESRGQRNHFKNQQDSFRGKLAECAAKTILSGLFGFIYEPDFSIYNGTDKSWDPDLKGNNNFPSFAVKSCNDSYPPSFVFQRGTGTDPLFFGEGSANTYFCPIILNSSLDSAKLPFIISSSFIAKVSPWSSARLEHRRSEKEVLYLHEKDKPTSRGISLDSIIYYLENDAENKLLAKLAFNNENFACEEVVRKSPKKGSGYNALTWDK